MLLEVRNLKKHYPIRKSLRGVVGHVKAVDGVSFHIGKGEIFGLVGESGCGKSTTGRCVLNLIEPTGGFVAYDGQTLFDVENKVFLEKKRMRALRKDMQIVFQDPFASLDPRMTAGAVVSEGLLKHRLAANRAEAVARAKELLEMCGMDASCIRKYPHEFSGGQRQRIGIARSLALNPRFLVADEPIAALDVSIQAQVLTLLCELKEKLDLTYLFISHDLGVVRFFCDRVAVMYLGNIVETGSGDDIFSSPLHPYSKALLSAIPKENPGDDKRRILLTGEIPSPANPPSGCKFHTRCPNAAARCKETRPELRELRTGHWAACDLAESL